MRSETTVTKGRVNKSKLTRPGADVSLKSEGDCPRLVKVLLGGYGLYRMSCLHACSERVSGRWRIVVSEA